MKVLVHMCNDLHESFINTNDTFANVSMFNVIEDMAPSLNETLINCNWPYQGDSCDELFVPSVTEEGLCFVFNALNSVDVYTDK